MTMMMTDYELNKARRFKTEELALKFIGMFCDKACSILNPEIKMVYRQLVVLCRLV